jgi:hypothetical protein
VHTLKVIVGGLALLALCLTAGRALGGGNLGLATGAKVFLPLWLLGAGVNLWVGVTRAGYSVADELPVFAMGFAVPAALAGVVWWWAARHAS